MSGRRVLLVDDEEMVRLSLRGLLEIAGYQVVGEAADGEQARLQAHQLRPDVILMDINMPRKDGLQAAREIMAANPVPIVFLTAYSDPENVARASEAGAFAYLVKPCRQADLVPAIETAVARFVQQREQERDLEGVRWALETVRRLSQEVVTNPDIEGVVGVALRCVTSALRAPAAALFVVRGGELRVRSGLGLGAEEMAAFRAPVGETLFGKAVSLGRPESFSRGDDEGLLGPWRGARHPFGECGSALAVPLPGLGPRDPALGCLAVLRAEAQAFSPAETSVLSTLASELLVAFQVAQTRQALAWRLWLNG